MEHLVVAAAASPLEIEQEETKGSDNFKPPCPAPIRPLVDSFHPFVPPTLIIIIIIMLKLTVCVLAAAQCAAFAPAVVRTPAAAASSSCSSTALAASPQVDTKRREGGVADELGIPCEGECSISRYPNLPESVHPGVLSGKALLDLLQDAKTKGKPADNEGGDDATFPTRFVVVISTEPVLPSASRMRSWLLF
jgi:hypothetical protein